MLKNHLKNNTAQIHRKACQLMGWGVKAKKRDNSKNINRIEVKKGRVENFFQKRYILGYHYPKCTVLLKKWHMKERREKTKMFPFRPTAGRWTTDPDRTAIFFLSLCGFAAKNPPLLPPCGNWFLSYLKKERCRNLNPVPFFTYIFAKFTFKLLHSWMLLSLSSIIQYFIHSIFKIF